MNISIEGESLSINEGNYIIIDGLYLDNIKNYITSNKIENNISLNKLKSKLFAYPKTNTPFAIIKLNQRTKFNVHSVRKSDYNSEDEDIEQCLSTDTGLLIIINTNLLVKFILKYDFNKLVDIPPIDSSYWRSLTQEFDDNDIGLLLNPGINSGFEFDGSGYYKIVI